MAVTIEIPTGFRVTRRNNRWTGNNDAFVDLLNTSRPIGGPYPADGDPERALAYEMAAEYGGYVVAIEGPRRACCRRAYLHDRDTDRVASSQRLLDRGRVGDVTGDCFDVSHTQRFKSRPNAFRRPYQQFHFMSGRQQLGYGVRAGETGASGDQDFHQILADLPRRVGQV